MKQIKKTSPKQIIVKQWENPGNRKQKGLRTEQTNRKEEKVHSKDDHILMKNKRKEEKYLIHVEFEAHDQKDEIEERNGGKESHKEYR